MSLNLLYLSNTIFWSFTPSCHWFVHFFLFYTYTVVMLLSCLSFVFVLGGGGEGSDGVRIFEIALKSFENVYQSISS
jgi:hypothetical protein